MKINTFQAHKRLQKIISTLLLTGIILLYTHDSDAIVISDLYISEVMANPSAVSDINGEWFEIYNPSNEIFDFNGITLSDNGSNTHQINQPHPLLIQPGDYFVFGRNGDELENGGYLPDYIYSNFNLSNTEDEIILSDNMGNILSLEYGSSFVTAGYSKELLAPEMLLTNYSDTLNFNYGSSDYGTPGSTGNYQFNTVAVPEPSSIWLTLSGLLLMFSQKKRIA